MEDSVGIVLPLPLPPWLLVLNTSEVTPILSSMSMNAYLPSRCLAHPAIPASAITLIHLHEFHGLDNEAFAQP